MEPLGDILRGYMAQVRISQALDQAGISPRVTGLEYELRIPTGFVDFDRLVGGLARPSSTAIGGRSGHGKTAFGLTVAHYVSLALNLNVAIFSLMSSRLQIAQRLLSIESEVDRSRILEGRLSQRDLARLGDALNVLSSAPIYIDDTPDDAISEFQQRASSFASVLPLDLVAVDSIRLSPAERAEASVEKAPLSASDADVRGVRAACRELNSAILVFFEIYAAGPIPTQEYARLDLVPDSLLQHCDCVALIERADIDSDRSELVDLHLVKNREGPTGSVSLVLVEGTGRLRDPGAQP